VKSKKESFSPTIATAIYIDEAVLCLKKEVMPGGIIKIKSKEQY